MTGDETVTPASRPRRADWIIESAQPSDQAEWRRLYGGYLDFYEMPDHDRVSDTVWAWIHDPAVSFDCIVARDPVSLRLVGLAHFRPFLRPLRGSVACYLDDLFVDPAARGTGAVDALLAAVREVAAVRGWDAVRWITRASNARARSTYDRLAQVTDLVTYEMVVGGPSD